VLELKNTRRITVAVISCPPLGGRLRFTHGPSVCSVSVPFIERFDTRVDTPLLVNTWMGDRLWTGKPFLYVTSQLSLSSLPGR